MSRGRLCRKCTTAYNGVLLDPAARLRTPLLRDGPKGGGALRPASWEQALSVVAERLTAISRDPAAGSGTILNTHYTGTFALLGYAFRLRFMRTLGAREVDPDTICNKAGHVALDYLYGTSEDGFDPRTAADAACILVWGANPSASAPHQHEQWLPEAPGRVVVIDSVRTETAREADLHLQPFPGSDAALAFAFAHVIQRDGLLDETLLRDHCIGWDELEPMVRECTPEWAAEVTGVPAAADRGRRRALRDGPFAALDRPGLSAPAARRQRGARGGAAGRAERQPGPARHRTAVPQRNR